VTTVRVIEIGSDGKEREPRDHDKNGQPAPKRKAQDLDPALTPEAIERLIRNKQAERANG
jgi:hypothetical protein